MTISNNLFSLIIGVTILGCQQDEEAIIQSLIEQRIQQRLTSYITIEKQRCREGLLEEASIAADSLLRANPVLISLDSLDRPPVPLKPVKPEFNRPKDSIKIAPIIPIKIEKQN